MDHVDAVLLDETLGDPSLYALGEKVIEQARAKRLKLPWQQASAPVQQSMQECIRYEVDPVQIVREGCSQLITGARMNHEPRFDAPGAQFLEVPERQRSFAAVPLRCMLRNDENPKMVVVTHYCFSMP